MLVSRRSDYNYWNGVGRTGDIVSWMPLPERAYFLDLNTENTAESEE